MYFEHLAAISYPVKVLTS